MRLTMECYADVSTCHITQADANLLKRDSGENDGICACDYEYGFWVPTCEIDNPAIRRYSKEFVALMEKASVDGAMYLRLDADGHVHDELPKFDW